VLDSRPSPFSFAISRFPVFSFSAFFILLEINKHLVYLLLLEIPSTMHFFSLRPHTRVAKGLMHVCAGWKELGDTYVV
jgi:hypothetical protein